MCLCNTFLIFFAYEALYNAFFKNCRKLFFVEQLLFNIKTMFEPVSVTLSLYMYDTT